MRRFETFVGRSSKPVRNEVEKGAIRKFAQAIGDLNPLYLDEGFAQKHHYRSILAPPTFSRTFDYGAIEGLHLPHDGLIHGEQQFEYARRIVAGDILYCSTKLLDVRERQGKLGHMTFLTFEHLAVDEVNQWVVKETSSIIYRGGESY